MYENFRKALALYLRKPQGKIRNIKATQHFLFIFFEDSIPQMKVLSENDRQVFNIYDNLYRSV